MQRGKIDGADGRREVRLVGMTVAVALAIVVAASAIVAWEKLVVLERPFADDVSVPIARLDKRLAQLHEKLEKRQTAQQARGKVPAIREKLYGEKDRRVTNSRMALPDVEIRARSTPLYRSQGDLEERRAQLHEQREEWQAAQQAWREVLAIRAKLYGETDWRVTDARLALRDVEIRARLTPQQPVSFWKPTKLTHKSECTIGREDFARARDSPSARWKFAGGS